jgi:hypothetical protein
MAAIAPEPLVQIDAQVASEFPGYHLYIGDGVRVFITPEEYTERMRAEGKYIAVARMAFGLTQSLLPIDIEYSMMVSGAHIETIWGAIRSAI